MDKSNYHWGVIGNCRSAAVINELGEIIWLCLPDFDSPSIFASMLDEERGGTWGIVTEGEWHITQHYLLQTNILVTRFERASSEKEKKPDIFELHDFMPRYRHTARDEYYTAPEVIRYIKYISGMPTFRVKYNPALIYGYEKTVTISHPDYIKTSSQGNSRESVYIYSNMDYDEVLGEKEIVLTQDVFMMLSYHQKLIPQTLDRAYLKMEKTKVYWLDWVVRLTRYASCPTYALYNDDIIRSSLVLKLMTFQNTGAVLAALTTSLPETLGEQRNWDYRFCWIRDASMTVSVFSDLNHKNTVRRYLKYILNLLSDKDKDIQIMYGIRGEKCLEERTLEYLSGYLNSKPVRVGNAAFVQAQHDVYGVLLDVINKSLNHLDYRYDALEDLWTITRNLVHTVSKVWREPDNGIWEFRGQKRHFVFSKVMCWVAVDRGLRVAQKLNMDRYVERWTDLCDEIKADVFQNGWNPNIGAFVQSYDSEYLDAANLLMEYYGFIDSNDPRFVATVMKSKEQLCENGLMYRYRQDDDFGTPSTSFTVCTFWLVYALHRIGMKDDAKNIFNGVLERRNSLGLLSEGIGIADGRLLGNFPQAYSHLALIACAELLNT